MKNWRQFVFCNNKISKKSNIAGKNEQNTTKFTTLTWRNAIVNNFSRSDVRLSCLQSKLAWQFLTVASPLVRT